MTASWVVEFDEDGNPVRMRWDGVHARQQRTCPKTWPHPAHGPWSVGAAVPAVDIDTVVFDCPGRPMVTTAGTEVTL